MDAYRLRPGQLPGALYRVVYTPSQTKYIPSEGLIASDKDTTYNTEASLTRLREDLLRRLDWKVWTKCRWWKSPFVNLFPDEDWTINWARKEPWLGGSQGLGRQKPRGQWSVLTIQTYRLPKSIRIFKISDLLKALKIKMDGIHEGARNHARRGYIALHMVLAKAITTRYTEDPSPRWAPIDGRIESDEDEGDAGNEQTEEDDESGTESGEMGEDDLVSGMDSLRVCER